MKISQLVSSPFWPLVKSAVILLATFLVASLTKYLLDRWSRRKLSQLKDKQKTTAVTTRMEVFRRVGGVLIWFTGIIVLVAQFPVVKSLGIGLFASAGVVGLVLGLAAQNTLSNMIAGIVLSFSQPLRLGDAVIMDDDFGYVEEITLMQTFIRTWDNRRIIVPNDVLSNRIVQNWSIKDSRLLAATIIYLDYGADIDKIRGWVKEAVQESEYWNGEGEPGVQVMDFTEKTIKVRALAWADDPPSAWNLRCEIREKLLDHFEKEGLEFPRFRVEVGERQLDAFGNQDESKTSSSS
ncbi:mechanosensitive ion channel family protein [Candidatus Bipolaricaulota bacterium]|nr:mechanosensitive ion channel family protein [Candidatus Bipolaricaulota bacterium]MBS3825939.1 mechanosensitive ion channel family protein [Candidatus Bipolaricaulota bacterium]